MLCAHLLADGLCNAPIVANSSSYSGFSHLHHSNWMHWASPEAYGPGVEETERIFKPCVVCGKKGPDNDAHMRYDGHPFRCE